jgi:FTR1 family protein
MIEAFVVTLREGVEAALVVCLALAYLRKIDRPDLRRTVWAGVAAAVALSIGVAVAVELSGFDPEGLAEGIVLLVSAAMVAWLLLWMRKHGRTMKQETERKLGELAGGPKFGIFLFTFLMVLREGFETVLLLLAVQFTTESILSAFAALAGLAVALALGVALYQGTFRVDLRKFFAVTTAILAIFAFQLVAAALHEFAEAAIFPTGEAYMRIVGPLMRNSALFVVAVLVLPFALMLRRAVAGETAAPAPANPAEERKERARSRAERVARASFAALAIFSVGALAWAYSEQARGLELSDPETVFEAAPEISLPVADLVDGKLHRFAVRTPGKLLRFIVLQKDQEKGEYGTAMDACTICFDKGYVQQGEQVLCRNCVAEIRPVTIGSPGGCNPIPVAHELRGDRLVIRLEDLLVHATYFTSGERFEKTCPVCAMKFPLEEAGGRHEGRAYCRMAECGKKLRGSN